MMAEEFKSICCQKEYLHSEESLIHSSSVAKNYRKRKNEIMKNFEDSSKKTKVDQEIKITGSSSIQDLIEYSLNSNSTGFVSEFRCKFHW